MSLVLDNLKKLKKKEDTGSVPPGMINLAPKRRGQRPSNVLLALLAFALVGFAITLYLSSGTPKYAVTEPVRISDQTAQPQIVINKPAPVETAQAKPSAEPSDKTSTPAQAEADIQKRIDDAVRKALSDKETAISQRLQENRDATIQSAGMAGKLPQTSETTVSRPEPQTSEVSVKNTEISAKAALQGYSEDGGTGGSAMTQKDREEFRKKVSYNTTLTIADRAYADGNYEKAIAGYTEAMKTKPTQATLLSLVRSKLAVGDVSSVPRLVSRYSYVTDSKGIAAVSFAMSDAGYASQAQELISDYKNSVENPSVLHYTSGLIYENSGKSMQAEQAYADAHREVPADAYYAYAYARAMDMNKKYNEAAEMYTIVASIDADSAIKNNASERALVIRTYLKRLEDDAKAKASAEAAESSVKE
jgi:tetratricopeptide (TPR) repeat protein